MDYTFFGFKEGCSYCGKPLGSSYSFCPFTKPTIQGCNRPECKEDILVKKAKCAELNEEVQKLLEKISELCMEQRKLGFLYNKIPREIYNKINKE